MRAGFDNKYGRFVHLSAGAARLYHCRMNASYDEVLLPAINAPCILERPGAISTPIFYMQLRGERLRGKRLSASYGLLKITQTTRQYGADGFKGGSQLGPHYAERQEPRGRLMKNVPVRLELTDR